MRRTENRFAGTRGLSGGAAGRGALRILAAVLLLAFVLQLAPGAALAAEDSGSWYVYRVHQPLTEADLICQGFDRSAFDRALDALRAASRTEGAQARVESLARTLLEEYDRLTTQEALAERAYYRDVRDDRALQAVQTLQGLQVTLADEAYTVFSEVLHSGYAPALTELLGEENAAALLEYAPSSEEDLARFAEEQRLIQAYNTLYSGDFSVEADGRLWTAEAFAAHPPEDPLARESLRYALVREYNARAGEIFLQLVQLRTREAREMGYDNFAEYQYAVYGRDYTPEDAKALHRAVKDWIVPIWQRISAAAADADDAALRKLDGQDGETILRAVEPYLDQIDPELGATFRFMRAFHLCDFEDGAEKMDISYTAGLPSYGSALVFIKPTGTAADYSSLVHEFGHFAAIFHTQGPSLLSTANLDVAEVQSQGLEALFSLYAGDLFEDGGAAFRRQTLYNLLYAVIQGCCQDELQTYVYEHPSLTLREINQAYAGIARDYGYAVPAGLEEVYDWAFVPHNFQSPCYYISYAVSALSALDLYSRGTEDLPGATQAYMRISATDGAVPYQRAMARCGLRDVFAPQTLRQIAQAIGAAPEAEPDPGERRTAETPEGAAVPASAAPGFLPRALLTAA